MMLLPACVMMFASVYWEPQSTASGEQFNPQGYTVAHKKLPLGTLVYITYRSKTILATVNDRGPYIRLRDIDLSEATARALGKPRNSLFHVCVTRIN